MSTEEEIATGERYFLQFQQASGGLYTADPGARRLCQAGRPARGGGERPRPALRIRGAEQRRRQCLGVAGRQDRGDARAPRDARQRGGARRAPGARNRPRGGTARRPAVAARAAGPAGPFRRRRGHPGVGLFRPDRLRKRPRAADVRPEIQSRRRARVGLLRHEIHACRGATTARPPSPCTKSSSPSPRAASRPGCRPCSRPIRLRRRGWRTTGRRSRNSPRAERWGGRRTARKRPICAPGKTRTRTAGRPRDLLDSNPDAALRAIDAAIAREPREARFHGTRGRILARQGRHREAVRAFGAAIRRDGNYYAYYLDRGLIPRLAGPARPGAPRPGAQHGPPADRRGGLRARPYLDRGRQTSGGQEPVRSRGQGRRRGRPLRAEGLYQARHRRRAGALHRRRAGAPRTARCSSGCGTGRNSTSPTSSFAPMPPSTGSRGFGRRAASPGWGPTAPMS